MCPLLAQAPPVLLIGCEGAGKSSLAAALSGRSPRAENLPGATVAVEAYRGADRDWVDTPGIVHEVDTATTALALQALGGHDVVLAVVAATHLDDDLERLLPLVAGRRGAIAVTHWDRVAPSDAARGVFRQLTAAIGVPVVPVDARRPATEVLGELRAAVDAPRTFTAGPVLVRAGWRIAPRPTVLEHRLLGPPLAVLALLTPALLAVVAAIGLSDAVEPTVEAIGDRSAPAFEGAPALLQAMLVGDYGLVTMGPLLLVWALPTVVVYALLLGAMKASGLLDRLTWAVHPLLRHVGLSGRDLVRVLMGFGCNVPAVVATRSCSACTRDTTIHAIAFGSACSYQLGATLAVFAAIRRPGLVVPYLAILAVTTLLYTRWVSDPTVRSVPDLAVLRGRAFLAWPRPREVWRDASTTIGHFLRQAMPVFLVIALLASLVDALGLLDRVAGVVGPLLAGARLPVEAALPVVLAAVRKDGVLLLASDGVASGLDAVQVLTAVYLAGVLLPCLVTALTIARERGVGLAVRLLARQSAAAVVFTVAIAWAGWALAGRLGV
jgi:ferrous iron transport protein B